MKNTQTEMGKISNLITDMTLKGATQDELARAVRHSMVVIDAENTSSITNKVNEITEFLLLRKSIREQLMRMVVTMKVLRH